jgi:hypothetical protein
MSYNHKTLHRQPRQQKPSTRKSRRPLQEPSVATDPLAVDHSSDACDDAGVHHKLSASRQPQCARGLSQALKKELLIDIEAAGGIQYVSVGRLANSKPEVYGHVTSARRKQVANIVYNDWKKLSSTSYLQLLSSLGVPATSQISSFYRENLTPARDTDSDTSSSPSTHTESSPELAPPTVTPTPVPFSSPPSASHRYTNMSKQHNELIVRPSAASQNMVEGTI